MTTDAAKSSKAWGPYFGLGLWVAAIALIADQANKLWFIFVYDLKEKGPVALGPFLDIVLVWNRGISYGLLQQDSAFGRWLLILFAVGVSLGLALWLNNAGSRLAAIAIGLIIGGALGNVIDRIAYGAVADFYSFHAFGYSWYVFNIADCAVVAGVIGLLIDALFGSRSAKPEAEASEHGASEGAE